MGALVVVSVYIKFQSPNPNDWWKPEYWKKSQFILLSLSVFTSPHGWWLHASCNLPQAGKGSHFMAPINPTVILLRSIFLISFCFFWFSEASWKSFQCNQSVFCIFQNKNKGLNNLFKKFKVYRDTFKKYSYPFFLSPEEKLQDFPRYLVNHVILKMHLSLNLPNNRYLRTNTAPQYPPVLLLQH